MSDGLPEFQSVSQSSRSLFVAGNGSHIALDSAKLVKPGLYFTAKQVIAHGYFTWAAGLQDGVLGNSLKWSCALKWTTLATCQTCGGRKPHIAAIQAGFKRLGPCSPLFIH